MSHDGNDGLYHVQVHRKGFAAALQLNFHSRKRAEDAFQQLRDESTFDLTDDFGARIAFDPEDIGHIVMFEAGKVYEMRVRDTMLQARAQSKVNTAVATDPVLSRGGNILLPRGAQPQ